MRMTYDSGGRNKINARTVSFKMFAGIGVAICMICGILLYRSFNAEALYSEQDENILPIEAASVERAVLLEENTNLIEKQEEYSNIKGAHDYSNFEYLVKEIGDYTDP